MKAGVFYFPSHITKGNIMVKLCVHLIALFTLLTATAMSQEAAVDSQKTYQLREVVVTATRSQILLKDSPSHVDLIDQEDIVNLNASTVADALQQASSIFLRQYGPNGALQTLSIRGGASEHILVLVNGNRVNSFQNGLVDASLLPLADVDRIEVLYGGSSALYGADALGGVINVITRQPFAGVHFRTEASSGSFGLEHSLLESSIQFGSVSILGGYVSERVRNDFSYETPDASGQYITATRENSDVFRRQFYAHTLVSLDEQSTVNASAQYVIANRGTPSPFSPLARQNDDDLTCSIDYRHAGEDGAEWKLASSFRYNLQDYNDPNPFFPYHTFYKNIYASVSPQVRFKLSEHQFITLGGELSQGTLESPDFDTKVIRVQKAVYFSSESQFEFNRQLFNRLVLYQTIRYDRISDVDFTLNPKIGINVRFSSVGDIRLHGSIGQSFRSPSFNDLYFRGFSNPDLKPERSTSFDAGVSTSFYFLGEHSVDYTYFHQDIENRILFDLSTFQPMNIGKVLSEGSEVKYVGQFFNSKLDMTVHYSFTDARKRNLDFAGDPSFDRQLAYIPADVLNVRIGFGGRPLRLNVMHSIVGGRYLTSDNTMSLPSFRVSDANIVVRWPLARWQVMMKAELNNIFDNYYEVIKDYPMPKRNYRLTLGLEY
jgi:vitamin B12 transporter